MVTVQDKMNGFYTELADSKAFANYAMRKGLITEKDYATLTDATLDNKDRAIAKKVWEDPRSDKATLFAFVGLHKAVLYFEDIVAKLNLAK